MNKKMTPYDFSLFVAFSLIALTTRRILVHRYDFDGILGGLLAILIALVFAVVVICVVVFLFTFLKSLFFDKD